jgi:uncharacterized protein (DUF2236 family)
LSAAIGDSLGPLDSANDTAFSPGSPIRRVSAEPVIGLLLLRALTMQVAHTKVGTAVSDHSSFERYPLRRTWTTTDAALRLVWGTPEMARAAVAQIHRFHDGVHGHLRPAAGDWLPGTPYTAHDPSLLLWVWATLLDTAQVAHARWLRPLEGDQADGYYADMCSFARSFGIPPAIVPPDRRAFAEYLEGMLAGEDLSPTPTSADMVKRVLWFQHPFVPAAAVRPGRVLAIATLDPRLCQRFGLELSTADRAGFGFFDGQLRRWYRYRPAGLLRALPPLYLAARKQLDGLPS